jgi:drug/metabolite transporter (DMT)-like permease
MSPARLTLITALALTAFAANSLLNRAALAGGHIDPASFTVIRIVSGAVMLSVLVAASGTGWSGQLRAGSALSAAALLAYAVFFSYAYLTLEAGMGALLLVGAVQISMIGWSLATGERPRPLRWVGIAAAVGGFVWLVSPGGVSAPYPLGAALMAVAGLSWGVYSLRGKGVAHPTAATAGNFLIAAPLALPLLFFIGDGPIAMQGVLLAVTSGAITSGLGYALWYSALRHLDGTVASILQLLAPAIAAAASVALLGEEATLRLFLAGLTILGGVALAIKGGTRPRASR